MQPLSPSATPFPTQAQDAFALFNVSAPGVLDPACMAAFASAPWKCMYGEYAVSTVAEDFMLHSFQYDLFQLGENVGGVPKTPAQLAYAETFRNRTRAAAQRDVIGPKTGNVMLPACYRHCNTGGATFSTAQTNGVTLEAAVVSWFSGSGAAPQFIVEDCKGLNCGTDCPPLPKSWW